MKILTTNHFLKKGKILYFQTKRKSKNFKANIKAYYTLRIFLNFKIELTKIAVINKIKIKNLLKKLIL